MSRKKSPPKYARHSSGQARVRIRGKVHYLGLYGSLESRQRYAELIAEWSADQAERTQFTIPELVLCYMDFAKKHYVKNGLETSELSCIRTAHPYRAAICRPTVRDSLDRRFRTEGIEAGSPVNDCGRALP